MSEFEPSMHILYIDLREPNHIAERFISLGYEVVMVQLTEGMGLAGDYYYKSELGETLIERKTVVDFDGSMKNGHLYGQAQELANWKRKKENRYTSIRVIGNIGWHNEHAGVIYTGRIGCMEGILGRYNIPVFSYPDEACFIHSIHKAIRNVNEDKIGEYRKVDLFKYKNPTMDLKSNDPRTIHTNIMRLYGASIKAAEGVVDAYNIESTNELAALDHDDLDCIKGIGGKTLAKIKNRMGIQDEEIE